ncbi:MAG: polyprenyl synthetase family protein [Candidatus Aminicenantales bacterium]
MKVEDRLAEKKEAIEQELLRILGEEDSLLFQAMKYAVFSGGKRYRPLLALASGECFQADRSVNLPFACALELIHTYSLIHDDLPSLDDDDFRRGKPACHKAYGEDIALLAGDGLLTLAFEVMAEAPLHGKNLSKKEEVIKEISHAAGVMGMIGGQLLDITFSPEGSTGEKIHDLIHKKTGALIVASVKTGAILGEASPVQAKAIAEYGKNVGLAFQIRDDILDLTQKKKKKDSSRPNYAFLFGMEEAKARLSQFVNLSLEALNQAALHSEELCYLSLILKEGPSGNGPKDQSQ